MSIRKYLSVEDQLKDLKNKKQIVIVDKESETLLKKYLQIYGYTTFVKKTSHPLMYVDSKQEQYKPEFTSNNLRYLFDIDRNIGAIIYKFFRSIEYLLNSSILKSVSKKMNSLNKTPYISALSEKEFYEIFAGINDETSHNKKKNNSLLDIFYDDLFKNYNNLDLEEVAKENKDKEDKNVIAKINNGWFYKQFDKHYKSKHHKHWAYIDIFSLFESVHLHQLIRIYRILNTSLKNEIIYDFCLSVGKKQNKLTSKEFEILIDIFAKLRNLISHNGYIIAFKFNFENTNKEEINKLIKYFNINNVPDTHFNLMNVVNIIEKILMDNKTIITDEIRKSIVEKMKHRTVRSNEKISPIIFEILKDLAGIDFDYREIIK